MKSLIIVGAGGFGRETAWLVERINAVTPTWNLLGFLDDSPQNQGKLVNGYPVLGPVTSAESYPEAYFVCAIACTRVRRLIIHKLGAVRYATLIDPAAILSDRVTVGEGSIICARAVLTVDISVGRHSILDVACTVGHDTTLRDFVTLYPAANVSGSIDIGCGCELGTGSQVIQQLRIGENTIIGAGAVVIRDLPADCTAVGCPAKPIKFSES